MMLIPSHLSVAQVVTAINAIISSIQFTLSASFAIVLIYFAPKTNSALAWSAVSRMLHSSIWPTLLSTDSSSAESAGAAVSTISYLTLFSIVLITIAGVTLPLGLDQGPLTPDHSPRLSTARYLADTSTLGLATTANPSAFFFGRVCGSSGTPMPCPGNGNDPNITSYAPSVIEIFGSTSHSPFSMQYRRPFDTLPPGSQRPLSSGIMGTAQSLLQREGAFVVESLIVDMSVDHPGIGFWNQTIPTGLPLGGTWSQDVLWLEPVTSCVNTNLTAEFGRGAYLVDENVIRNEYNLTYHSELDPLALDIPPIIGNGQNINVQELAYRSAILSNLDTMQFLAASQSTLITFDGVHYHLKYPNATTQLSPVAQLGSSLGGTTCLGRPRYFNDSNIHDANLNNVEFACGLHNQTSDMANITNVHVMCGAFVGPPYRTDRGNPSAVGLDFEWGQQIHICSSATRASVQTVKFSVQNLTDVQNIRVAFRPSNQTAIWGVEETNMTILNTNPLWGRVDEKYENDPSISTLRKEGLFLPAVTVTKRESFDFFTTPGEPLSAHAAAWNFVYGQNDKPAGFADYSGSTDYSIETKLRSFVDRDPLFGHAHIRNAIWTDIMANLVIGTMSNSTILVAPYRPTLQYNFKFAIPGFILSAVWLPAFLSAIFLLATRQIRFGYMKQYLNHTSVGRVVTGSSLLRVEQEIEKHQSGPPFPEPTHFGRDTESTRGKKEKDDWAHTIGATRVTLYIDRKSSEQPWIE